PSRNLRRSKMAACSGFSGSSRLYLAALGDDLERAHPGKRRIPRQPVKICIAFERVVEKRGVAPARDFDRAETAQVLGDILGVEQFKAASDQSRDQMHQRDFRGIARAVEHAFAEEG